MSRSSVDRLGVKAVQSIEAALDAGASLDAILEQLKAQHHEVSRSALHRWTQANYAGVVARAREQRSRLEALAAESGVPEGNMRGLVLRLQAMVEKLTQEMLDAEDTGFSPLDLTRLSGAVRSLSGVLSQEQDREIRAEERARAVADAAKAGESAARRAGASPETIALIRAEILGLREAPAEAAA